MRAAVLNFESEAFAQMKKDMNDTLHETLKTMLGKDYYNASITVKLTIDLDDEYTADERIHTHDAEREIIVPKIEHKVSSTLQIKSERKGKIGGKGFELVKDESGKFILKPIGPEQINLFEPGDDAEPEDDVDEGADSDEYDDEA